MAGIANIVVSALVTFPLLVSLPSVLIITVQSFGSRHHDSAKLARESTREVSFMDRNECREIEDRAARLQWVLRYTEIRQTKLCAWVSTFHPQNLTCQTEGRDSRSDKRGSYNIVCKVRFDKTGETWAVRFPQSGKHPICDEKLEAEVAAIDIVRGQTDIPVPEIKAWGLARDNELGLGPFVLSTWVDGISLHDVLTQDEDPSRGGRMMRKIANSTIERLWRQIARFMLQLSQISFDHIGSCTSTPRRPLTIKSHHIQESGVEISCKCARLTLYIYHC